MDDSAMRKWFSIEMRRLHKATVRQPRPLHALLEADDPTAPTHEGEHRFDKEALQALAATLRPLTRERLHLPIRLYVEHDTPGSVYVSDPIATEALEQLGAKMGARHQGKAWMGHVLARDLARRFPTCFQFVHL